MSPMLIASLVHALFGAFLIGRVLAAASRIPPRKGLSLEYRSSTVTGP